MPQATQYVSAAYAKKFFGITVIPGVPTTGAPVVNPQTMQNTLPITLNEVVGTVVASNTPTSWAIASGGGGQYAISNAGVITCTAAGVTGINAGTDYLLISAINASGTGQAIITIETT
jgi:hypothetical protein